MTLECIAIALAAGLKPIKQSGNEIFYRCPNHDDNTPSLQINTKKNCFLCGPCGKSGGAWKFAAFLARKDPADKQGILRWVEANGLSDRRPESVTESLNKKNGWQAIWEGTIPITDRSASIARSYLQNRGLAAANLPACVRFHPNLPYWETSQNGNHSQKGKYPALIALVTDERGKPTGILRTYLTHDGFKAPHSEPKKALGVLKGSAIHLDEPNEVLHVTEGLETGMSVFQSIQEPTWPALSTSGMRDLCIPKTIKSLHVWADGDRNQAGQNAAFELARRAVEAGIAAYIHVPAGPIPADKKNLDWLDVFITAGADTLVAELEQAEPFTITETPHGLSPSTDDWDPPLPFYQFDLPKFPTYVFPDWLRRFVEAVAIGSQTPADMAAMLAISILSICCQKKFIVKVQSGYTEPTNTYTVTALPPGNRKSAVFKEMTLPIEKYEQAEALRMAPEIAAGRTRYKILQDRLNIKQQTAAKAKKIEEMESHQLEAENLSKELARTVVPSEPRLLADDTTPEKLTTLIRDQGGRMALLSPEGDIFDLMAGRYSKNGAPNFTVYLKSHAGDELRVDRTGRPSEFVHDPALTVGLTVQPDIIRGLSQKDGFRGRGLLGRFLYSMPESLLGHREIDPPQVPDYIRREYHEKITALLALPFTQDEAGQSAPYTLALSPAAKESWLQFAANLEPKLAPFGEFGSMTDWAGKLAGAVIRFAGLLHVAQHADTKSPWGIPVSLKTMQSAIRIGEYLIPHARAAFAEMGADPAVEGARHILAWIEKKHRPSLTKRDIFEGTKGRFKRADDLNKPIELLIEHGFLRNKAEPQRRGPGKPPSPAFEVNPSLGGDSANKTNIANTADGRLKSHLKDSLTPREEDSCPSPKGSSGFGDISCSQYSHNSQNPEGEVKGLDVSDSQELEEILL
jgi:hypothetical protein